MCCRAFASERAQVVHDPYLKRFFIELRDTLLANQRVTELIVQLGCGPVHFPGALLDVFRTKKSLALAGFEVDFLSSLAGERLTIAISENPSITKLAYEKKTGFSFARLAGTGQLRHTDCQLRSANAFELGSLAD